MTYFEQYLISIGYKRYRKVFDKKAWHYIEDSNGYFFSTMIAGCLDYRYILNGGFEDEIIFGLHEKSKPPTLIWPRTVLDDDSMNIMLKDNTPEEIYKLIT